MDSHDFPTKWHFWGAQKYTSVFAEQIHQVAFAAPAVASAGRRLLPHGPSPAGLLWERWAELGCNCDHHTIITIITIATTLPPPAAASSTK